MYGRNAPKHINQVRNILYMELHDPHTISEPVLVLTVTAYLLPAYMAYIQGYHYMAFSNLFLSSTTIGFHWSRNDYIFALDCLAILNYLGYGIYCIKNHYRPYSKNMYILSAGYALISYFVGQRFKIMSFDPDWNRQMFFHGLMHIFSSYTSYEFIQDLNNHPQPSAHYHTLPQPPPHLLQSYHH